MLLTNSLSLPIVLSVVSHGHGEMVQRLLYALAKLGNQGVARVVLTLNYPEPEPVPPLGGWPFLLQVRHNKVPQGFSVNHNDALKDAPEAYVCIINPDVQLCDDGLFSALVLTVQQAGVGLAYPTQIDEAGRVQDSEREVPTPWSLLRRYTMGRKETRAEWVNGAMWLLPNTTWRSVGGLDPSYFMYGEDVDFCLRLRLAGWMLARSTAVVVHAGQRASHRRLRHALWHIRSLLRLWTSGVFWRSRALLRRLPAASLLKSD
ncbi:MAG: glycosyltransferase [Comamonas sp.]